jgi:class 3 adenylate cyclase
MAKLSARERASLPDSSFAYIDSLGNRRLPINDEPHVRNALARFGRVQFEDDEARDRARGRLLNAAKRYGIMPVGFIAGQLRSERGARGMAALPTGTVTFLLTDVEGSTGLLRQLEDDYVRVLREMRGEIRGCVRRAGGHSVDTHGDEYFAVFAQASEALHAAIDLQRAMREHRWPQRCEVLVRAGLHTGRPALTDSGYVGLSVHTVARICTVAHGGQIVASAQAVTGMDVRPTGVKFRDLGEHKLTGLPKPERLFQIDAPGQQSAFPPLRV